MIAVRSLWPVALCAVLAGCAGVPVSEPPAPAAPASSVPASSVPATSTAPAAAPAPTVKPRPGGYYLDDGPGDRAPDAQTLATIADAVPRDEPLHRFANRPYSALGLSFVPLTEHRPFRQRGRASWYGRKFHGQKTSSGEPYDMYGMTAAHATLPIPSYARVTHLASGRSVVVRVNDRGPFKPGRVIDLSWTAAAKLGYVNDGSADVEVEAVFAPGSAGDLLARRAAGQPEITRPAPEPAASALPDAPADDVIAALAADGAGDVSSAGHWLQLGAFSTLDNAQALSRRVAAALGELADRISVASDGDRHRVRAGPFASRDAAQGAARALRDQLGLDALLIAR
jgi:rare lipoprotein A